MLFQILIAAVGAASAQTVDRYGGYVDLPAPGGSTGFFRVEEISGRWTLVTPDGNAFWMRSVYLVAPYGLTFPGKYTDIKQWAVQANRRLKAWGFNALGEYSYVYTFPVGTYGSTYTNPEKLPFVRLIRPSQFALDNRWGLADHPVIDLISGVDPIHKIYRAGSFPDVYSSSFEQTVDAIANDRKQGTWTPIFPQKLATSPWLIGTSSDDADFLYGFKRGWTEHLGWMVAVANPLPTSGKVGSIHKTVTYTDRRFYTKEAWRTRLKTKYGTIAALNTAWGSSYTTFDSDGGWPFGRGLMDESGRNPWMQPIPGWLGVSNPVIQAELNAMMEQVADKYFSLVAKYIRQYTPHHLVFGPAPLHDAKPQILRAAARYVDVLQAIVSPYPDDNLANLESFLDRITAYFRKPIFLWTTFTSQANSPLVGRPNAWGDYDRPTQEQRGAGYRDYLGRVLAYTAPYGVRPIVGVDWWSWTDNTGEGANFGLVSLKDNAYDGQEAAIPAGTDPWGYPTGGEVANYGDFLTMVTAAHAGVLAALTSGSSEGATPLVSLTSPLSGDIVGSLVPVTLTATATDDDGLTQVDFLLNGGVACSVRTAPDLCAMRTASYRCDWHVPPGSKKTYEIRAKAYDAAGNVSLSAPVNVTTP